jgi:hypothetical protein
MIYVRPMTDQRESTGIKTVDVHELDGCAWIEEGIGYALIANEDYAHLLELSQDVRHELASRG